MQIFKMDLGVAKLSNKLSFLLAYIMFLIFFVSTALIFKITNSGKQDIIAFLIYYTLYGSIIVIIGCLIIENIIKSFQGKKTLMIVFTGFLYGLVLSFVFGISPTSNTIYINVFSGLIFSLGFLIYSSIRK